MNITKLAVENFKCFAERQAIPISKLTICTGVNSVGKSTFIQALILLRQSYQNSQKCDKPQSGAIVLLNTDSLNLGSTNQIMLSDKMYLQINDIWFKYVSGDDKLSLRIDSSSLINNDDLGDLSLFNTEFYYIGAERVGPRNYQEMKSHETLNCGIHGEFTFDMIEKNPLLEISDSRRLKRDSTRIIADYAKQVDYWISYIVNGVEVEFSSDLSTQLARMKLRQSALDTPFNSPYNFGFGISYVLPIVAMGLIAKSNAVMIVENPEAHLHPAGQSRIGEFLAQTCTDGVQIVVETHSEHVINGMRKFALRNGIPPEDFCINHFSINPVSHKHETNRLILNQQMDILTWPDGFFDQEEKDLKELREIRRSMK